MNDPDDHVVVTRKMLEQIMNFKAFKVHPDILVSPGFEIDFNMYRIELEKYVLAEQLAEDVYTTPVSVSWPRSTWQMFKSTHNESWWMRWFTKRRPVLFTTTNLTVGVEVKRYLKYPEAEIHDKRLGRPVIMEIVNNLGRLP